MKPLFASVSVFMNKNNEDVYPCIRIPYDCLVTTVDKLQCAICNEVPRRPFALQCQHIFCGGCLSEAFRHGLDRCSVCRDKIISAPVSALFATNYLSTVGVLCDHRSCYWQGIGVEALLRHRKECPGYELDKLRFEYDELKQARTDDRRKIQELESMNAAVIQELQKEREDKNALQHAFDSNVRRTRVVALDLLQQVAGLDHDAPRTRSRSPISRQNISNNTSM